METHVRKWGNSLGLRIPKGLANDVGIGEDTLVELVSEDGRLVVIPVIGTQSYLETLLAGVTDENLHGEVDTGPAVGGEEW